MQTASEKAVGIALPLGLVTVLAGVFYLFGWYSLPRAALVFVLLLVAVFGLQWYVRARGRSESGPLSHSIIASAAIGLALLLPAIGAPNFLDVVVIVIVQTIAMVGFRKWIDS